MKILAILAILALLVAVALSGLAVFANMMKPSETGGFIGADLLVVAWLIAGVLAAVAWG